MRYLFSSLLLLLVACSAAWGLDVPPLQGRVNDYAHILSPGMVQQLDGELAALERTDSTQVVVLTIPSLEGEDLEGFSIKVAEKWRIGQKGLDNGAILLIAKAEHKVRIEVGRGLEGKLTDLVSGRIIRNEIVPRFRSGDFDGGVAAGVAAIASVVKGEYSAQQARGHGGHRRGPSFGSLLLGVLLATVVIGAMSRWLGSLVGAFGLSAVAWFIFPALSLVALIGIGIAGLVVGLLLAALFGGGGGGWGGGYGGGGPFMGGWYGGGGGGGDSGFSGGGGDFGGGGASGDW